MAERPIIWAAGTAGLIAFVAAWQGSRLAEIFAPSDGPNAAAVTVPAGTSANPSPAASRPAERPTLTVAADYRGHYVVHPMVDNFRVKMLVDTGASLVALSAGDARALGIRLGPGDYRVPLNTANGSIRAARVTLREIRLGNILVRNVDAVVMPEGALSISLLGTSFLGKLQGYEVQTGRMVLRG